MEIKPRNIWDSERPNRGLQYLLDSLNHQLAGPITSSNTLPQCDEFPKEVCGYSGSKAPRFLPVCALLIALPMLAPSPSNLSVSLSRTYCLSLNLSPQCCLLLLTAYSTPLSLSRSVVLALSLYLSILQRGTSFTLFQFHTLTLRGGMRDGSVRAREK